MTTFKTALLAATALTLMSGAALAQAGNFATSTQDGTRNSTEIKQQGRGNGHFATSDVTGDRNDVEVDQNAGLDTNTGSAQITIGGFLRSDDNDVSVSQSSFQSRNREEQTATIRIDGDANSVTTDQRFGDDSVSTNTLTVNINANSGQQSDVNLVEIEQANNGNSALVDVWGDRNELYVSQGVRGGGGNTARLYVDGANPSDEGSDNAVEVVQDYVNVRGLWAAGNEAEVRINGNRNTGTVEQVGAANNVNVRLGSLNSLDANENTFDIYQEGLSNLVNGIVLGDLNEVSAVQVGELNELSFSQDGNSNFVQSFQEGTSNLASVTQTGDANSAVVSQVGTDNFTSITQGGAGVGGLPPV